MPKSSKNKKLESGSNLLQTAPNLGKLLGKAWQSAWQNLALFNVYLAQVNHVSHAPAPHGSSVGPADVLVELAEAGLDGVGRASQVSGQRLDTSRGILPPPYVDQPPPRSRRQGAIARVLHAQQTKAVEVARNL